MKRLRAIEAHPRVTVVESGDDGGVAVVRRRVGPPLRVLFSWGEGWDHVSVSRVDGRVPGWEDMRWVKAIFFRRDEWAVEYHPPDAKHISHAEVLHLWRPQAAELLAPPEWMV